MAIDLITNFQVYAKAPLDAKEVVADQTERLAIIWLYEGLISYQTDTGQRFKYIGDTISNTVADWEIQLALHTGVAVPDNALGAVDDVFIDTVNGVLYKKTGVATWTAQFDFSGAAILTSVGVPDNGDGVDGDMNVSDAGDVYIKEVGVWDLKFNIAGANGLDGDKYATSSATSVNLGTISFPFAITVAMGLAYTAGQEIIAASVAAPDVDFIDAIVGSYVTGTGVLTLVSGTLNGTGTHTDWEVNIKGARGKVGKAFIHTESDINLTQAKITTVEGGVWTEADPWSASVLNDTRTGGQLTATPGILGNMGSKSIAYDGTNWYVNGTWRGPTGLQGVQGIQGIQGIQGLTGDTGLLNITVVSSPAIITGYVKGWYLIDVGTNGSVTLGENNQVGTVLTISANKSNTSPALNAPPPSNTQFSYNISTVSTNNKISYKGRFVTSIPVTSRSITLICINQLHPTLANTWIVVGEAEYREDYDVLSSIPNGVKTIGNDIGLRSLTNEIHSVSPTRYGRFYDPLPTVYPSKGFKFMVQVQVELESDQAGGDQVQLFIKRTVDDFVWTTIDSRYVWIRGDNVPHIFTFTTVDFDLDGALGGFAKYRLELRLVVAGNKIIATNIDRRTGFIVPILLNAGASIT